MALLLVLYKFIPSELWLTKTDTFGKTMIVNIAISHRNDKNILARKSESTVCIFASRSTCCCNTILPTTPFNLTRVLNFRKNLFVMFEKVSSTGRWITNKC